MVQAKFLNFMEHMSGQNVLNIEHSYELGKLTELCIVQIQYLFC
jgi:hypothetical protein